MEEDTFELIQRLCTRAGMIMEDASVEALTISKVVVIGKLERLTEATAAASMLLAAAGALNKFSEGVR